MPPPSSDSPATPAVTAEEDSPPVPAAHCTGLRKEYGSGQAVVNALGDAGLTQLRRDRIGFVFQSFNLIPTLTAAENIALPVTLAGRAADPERLAALAGC
jgi:ABC-type lipoprotein export system ATPase subunit